MKLLTKKIWALLLSVNTLVFVFIIWWIYGYAGHQGVAPAWTHSLPEITATLNALSAVALGLGFRAILNKKPDLHRNYMLSALVLSAFFLVAYLGHHHFHGDTAFTGTGAIRLVYFFILISHVVLTMGILPLILATVGLAFFSKFEGHKKVARITFPIWMYINVTGVLIYWLLRANH